jgi:hypothetical protein
VRRSGRRSSPLDWVVVALLALLCGVVAVFGVFYLPAYSGATPVPVVVVVVGVALAVIPRVAYRLTRRLVAAFAPALVWFAVTVGLILLHNGLYLAVPVVWQGWQLALLLGVGALSGAASLGLLWGDHVRAQIDSRSGRSPDGTVVDSTPASGGVVDAVRRQSVDGGY